MDTSSEDIIKSITFAGKGVEASAAEDFKSGIKWFTEAINLYPKDHRYFINRSWCYFFSDNLEQSLNDADRAIQLKPDHPKGHFRRAMALVKLGRDFEAIHSFDNVLKFDPNCDASKAERERLISNNSNGHVSNGAKTENVNVINAMKTGKSSNETSTPDESSELGNNSSRGVASKLNEDGDQIGQQTLKQAVAHHRSSGDFIAPEKVLSQVHETYPGLLESDKLKIPTNILKYNSLWVSNLSPTITKSQLSNIFSKYGEIVHFGIIRNQELPYKQVVIHYDNPISPASAMSDLRDTIFDANVAFDSMKPLTMRFTPDLKQRLVKLTVSEAISLVDDSQECFDWRGPEGCQSRSECTASHFRATRAVDSHLFLTHEPDALEQELTAKLNAGVNLSEMRQSF